MSQFVALVLYLNGIISDDHMIQRSMAWHQVAVDSQDAITQYLNAGGMDNYVTTPTEAFKNGLVVSSLLLMYELGLFANPYLPDDFTEGKVNTDETAAVASEPKSRKRVALIGQFVDTVNLGGYIRMGVHERMITPRQAIVNTYVDEKKLETHWGAPIFLYYDLNIILNYLFTPLGNSSQSGLKATYYTDKEWKNKAWEVAEGPMLEYEHYSPSGPDAPLPSRLKAVLGVMTRSENVTIYVNDVLHSKATSGSIKYTYSDTPDQFWDVYEQNPTMVPTGSAEFTFKKGTSIKIRIDYQGSNAASGQRLVAPAWNLVDRKDELEKARRAAREANYVIFIAGGSVVVDQETNDMSTLGLSPNQTALADAVFAAGKPVILVTTGTRPLALPEYYRQAAAVLYTGYSGQAGGQVIADILYGKVSPSGPLPITVPYSASTSPAYYNHDNAAYRYKYVDIPNRDVDRKQIPSVVHGGGITYNPLYHFRHGLSYTSFNYSQITADKSNFAAEDAITFEFSVTNTGAVAGREIPPRSYPQALNLVVLVGFTEVDLQPGETQKVSIQLYVNRYLSGYDRWMKWRVEPGTFVFAPQPSPKDESTNKVTLTLPSS
ncbi:glycosyl hydrolase family 3 C-terminal domain-containing protein [Morchella snyderi]|nr:glycosyl hydrolase family 3 C-terminal domain-containing protein [Morchella snyderi]